MRVYEATLTYTPTLWTIGATNLSSPEKAHEYLKDIVDFSPAQETLWVVMLTTKQTPIARILITKGTATASLAHPREIFKPAILANAVSILLAHNHPSGQPEPSGADIALTRQVREAGKVLGIELLDHLILGDRDTDPSGKGFYSFRHAGLL